MDSSEKMASWIGSWEREVIEYGDWSMPSRSFKRPGAYVKVSCSQCRTEFEMAKLPDGIDTKQCPRCGPLEAPALSHQKLSAAICVAAEAHFGQVDKGNTPYILHPLAVMMTVPQHVTVMIVAVLHDVLEDTIIGENFLRERFSDNIVDAILLLSREPAGTPNRMPYAEYIEQLAPSYIARKVKMADLEHNLSRERMMLLPEPEKIKLEARYENALRILERYETKLYLGLPQD